jgi:hypothetical protein
MSEQGKLVWAALHQMERSWSSAHIDAKVWAVCPYARPHHVFEPCLRCPSWEGEGDERGKRGCRMYAEEVVALVLAALPECESADLWWKQLSVRAQECARRGL